MNLDVTSCAVGVLSVLVMRRAGRFDGSDIVRQTVACQAELVYCAVAQQPRICRAVRCVTRAATFSFHRCVFVSEGALLVGVTLDASRISASGQARLFQFKSAVRIVTVAALHRAFQHFVMEGQLKLVLDLAVTAQAELRFARFE